MGVSVKSTCKAHAREQIVKQVSRFGGDRRMDILKIAVLGIAGALLAILLRKEKPEYSIFISLSVCICIFVYIITKLSTILEFSKKLEEALPVDSRYIMLLLKMIGITYIAEFAMNICKDSGYAAIGNQIEIFAKMTILVISIPVLTVFLETISSMI